MQKYIFKSLDGITPSELVKVFCDLILKEEFSRKEVIANHKSDYQWVIGIDVWKRIRSTNLNYQYPISNNETKLMGIDLKITMFKPQTTAIILERKEPKEEKKVLVGDITSGYHYVSLDEAGEYESNDDLARFNSGYITGMLPKTSDLVRKYNLNITIKPHNIFEGGVNVYFTKNRKKFGYMISKALLESINWDWKFIDKELCSVINRNGFELNPTQESIAELFLVPESVINYCREDAMRSYEYWKKNNEYLSNVKERLNAMYGLNSRIKVKDITVKKGVTTLVWSDGDVTMVSCGVEDDFDLEKGIAMAVAKKFLGTNKSKSNFNDEIHRLMDIAEAKYAKRQEKEAKKIAKKAAATEFMNPPQQRYVTVKKFAEMSGMSESAVRKSLAKGSNPKAFKANGKWMIPVEEVE